VHPETADELDRFCILISNYFVNKISHLKLAVAANTATLAAQLFPDQKFSGTQLDFLLAVTFGTVYKLIISVKPETSSDDYIPTSLIKSCPAVFSHLIVLLQTVILARVFPSMFKAALASCQKTKSF
jgi:hypothetical protein